MITRNQLRATLLLALATLVSIGCAKSAPEKPRPEAARQVLKLRGYDFNADSFIAAIDASDEFAIQSFLDGGIDVNVRRKSDGQTPLIFAAANGKMNAAKVLLNHNADVNLKDSGNLTALFRAFLNGHDDIAKLLVEQTKLDVNARGLNDVTALISYTSRNQTDVVESLVARNADVNAQDKDGDAPIHLAARNGNVEILKLLVAKGAKLDLANKVGGTALMWAAAFGHTEAARFLIDHGANVAVKDGDGMTAAAWAARNKQDEVVQLLLSVSARGRN